MKLRTALMFVLAMALTVGLAACSGCSTTPAGPMTVHQRIEAACAGTATALEVITVANNANQLTKKQVDAVTKARDVIKPTCVPASGDYPYTMSEAALSELESSADTLKELKTEVEK